MSDDHRKVEIVGATFWIGLMLLIIAMSSCEIADKIGKIADKIR